MDPTPHQVRILRAIRTTAAVCSPFPPRLEDIRLELGLSTRSAVTYHLPSLEAAGWVEMGPNRRGLALTTRGEKALRRAKVTT